MKNNTDPEAAETVKTVSDKAVDPSTACSVTPFDHTRLDEYFENMRRVRPNHHPDQIVCYLVKDDINWVDEVIFLQPNEMRIHVDNFPAQKMGFTSNLPIRTMEEFQRDVERTGIKLIRSQNDTAQTPPDSGTKNNG